MLKKKPFINAIWSLIFILTGVTIFIAFNRTGTVPLDIKTATFPKIVYSPDSLSVTRSDTLLQLGKGSKLYPGDIIETGTKHFAVIAFSSGGLLMVHPFSKIEFCPESSLLNLKSADIYFESQTSVESFTQHVTCFDAHLKLKEDHHTRVPVAYSIQCRGEDGISVSSQKGTHFWSCFGKQYELFEGTGLQGRVTSSDYLRVVLPERPPAPAMDTTRVRFQWDPVPMADQYLIHIYTDTDHHMLTFHPENNYSINDFPPGSYYFRVKVLDYYGMTGLWSEPVSFEIREDT